MGSRVDIWNLAYDVNDKDLYYFFYQFGEVEHAEVIVDGSGSSKGYGFVTFHGPEIAKNVIEVSKRHNIWMRGRILRIEARRRVRDEDSDDKVPKNIELSDTSTAKLNDDRNSVEVDTAQYQWYCCPTQNASYAVYNQLPYTQISEQDMSLYPAPWHNMSYAPIQSHTVPIPLAPIDQSYSSYNFQGEVLTEKPIEPYMDHQDTHMYMVTYDDTQSNVVQCGNSIEYFIPTENHQNGYLYPDMLQFQSSLEKLEIK